MPCGIAPLLTEERMAKAPKSVQNPEEAAAAAPSKPNHSEKIKSQVLAKIGTPPRLHRVEVCNHHNGKYRVNIWEQPDPQKGLAVTVSRPYWAILLFDGVGDRRDSR